MSLDRKQSVFTYQTPATLNQAGPVQNQWYTILPTTTNAAIYHICVMVATQAEDLELRITIDGQTIEGGANSAAGADMQCLIFLSAITLTNKISMVVAASDFNDNQGIRLEGRSITVEVRKTSAVGAGNLYGIVSYGKMP